MKNYSEKTKHNSRTARLAFALLMALYLTVTMIPLTAFAAGEGDGDASYAGKTVVLYTGNLRGDVDVYAKAAAAKKDFAAKGADAVYLVDAGNYLQGTTYANSTRGEAIYDLMDAAGYDVAAMGLYEFTYGDATTGYIYHGNFTKYHTQKQLLEGAAAEEYNKNRDGSVKATLPAKAPAKFKAISSTLVASGETSGFYSFDDKAVLGSGSLSVGMVAATDPQTADYLQNDFLKGYGRVVPIPMPTADVVIGLSNDSEAIDGAAYTIQAPTEGEEVTGALVIDNASKTVTEAELELQGYPDDPAVAAAVTAVKNQAEGVLFTNDVTLNGADRTNWKEESNLGDLTADALLWYANNKFEGFKKDVPVVAIQNGGNCDNFMYTKDVTKTDLLRSLPFSPMGVGILYLTGEQLLETLEAGTSPSTKYSEPFCPGFAQVAGIKYNVDRTKAYDKGEPYGDFYVADSINRVSITSIDGKTFNPNAQYAVIADNFLMNGNDTYYVFKKAKEAGAKYLNNGGGVLTRDIVNMYVKEQLNGKIGKKYAEPQKRITIDQMNPMTAKGKTATVKYKALKKKAQTLKASKVFKVSKAKGAVTYKKASGNKKITVTKKGVVKVKKGLKKGTYPIDVLVTAAGNKSYASKTVQVTAFIKIK